MGSRPYYACAECRSEINEDTTTNDAKLAYWCGACSTYDVEVVMSYD